jgi:hypothetical protein
LIEEAHRLVPLTSNELVAMAVVAVCFQGARTALIDRSRGVLLHFKIDPIRSNKQELYRASTRPATIAVLLRAATTNHCIAGEISAVSAGSAITMSKEIHSDVRGHRFSTVPCRGAPVSEAFHKARLCRSAARLSGCWRYAEIRRVSEVAEKDDWSLVFEAQERAARASVTPARPVQASALGTRQCVRSRRLG